MNGKVSINSFDARTLKRKASMVLFEFEQELGRFVAEFEVIPSGASRLVGDIADREARSGRALDSSNLGELVQATYLDEVFALAQEVTRETSDYEKVCALRQKCIDFEVFEIRNALAHPNRPFLETYWYRVAAVVSDPSVDQLGLTSLRDTLISAESGIITDPPDDWFRRRSWEVPNNLPERLDHAITGLVGRTKERDALLKLLRNPRVASISVLAPGGVGKTALVLDLMKDVVLDPSGSAWVEGVVFISMKTERLTATGLEELTAVETMQGLEAEIARTVGCLFETDCSTLDEAATEYGKKKLILFVDNLETVLRDDPRPFEEFSLGLPPSWRILITSRLPVDGSSAMPIDLLPEKAAIHLAQTYATRKGIEFADRQPLEDIAKKCFCNPLAIRLSIDLFANGKEVPDSIHIANKEIAQFSYNNLIQSISEQAVHVLEALFISGKLNRGELCELLESDSDQVAIGVAELARTSLIRRIVDGPSEQYELNSSVQDLLLRNPRNIEIRAKIQDRIAKRHAAAHQIRTQQRDKRISVYNTEYIPADLSEALQLLIRDTNTNLRRRSNLGEVIALHARLAQVESLYETVPQFFTAFGRVLERMQDLNGAERRYRKAIELDGEHPVPSLLLAKCLAKANRQPEAETILSSLVERCWVAPETSGDLEFASSILSSYMYTLLYQDKHSEVLEFTAKWKEDKNFAALLGAFRAGAYKRAMENIVDDDPLKCADLLQRAIAIMGDVIRRDGYFDVAIGQTMKLIDEIEFVLGRKAYRQNNAFVSKALDFVAEHLIVLIDRYKDRDKLISIVFAMTRVEVPNNPFRSLRWKSLLENGGAAQDDLDREALEAEGYIVVSVSNIPVDRNGNMKNFIFARSEKGEDYFLHNQNFRSGWQNWLSLDVGRTLVIKPGAPVTGRSAPASEIRVP